MDTTPDHSNRIASLLGRIFHPYFISILTVMIILSNLSLSEALRWSALVLILVLVPGILLILYLRRQDKQIYQRKTRTPVYLVVLASVVICVGVLYILDAPKVLIACIATLAIWLPVQLLINTFITKISTHVAVIAGCSTALWYLDKLDSPAFALLAVLAVVLTMWSRITTKNHTYLQVTLGLLVGGGSVLVAFPLLLG